MKSSGIMDQIRDLLVQGKSSRELIDMGYSPGSVYGTMRKMRLKDAVGVGHAERHSRQPASRPRMPESPVRHMDPALTCPGCQQEVAHWAVCPCCNRLIPLECTCAVEGSPHFGKVYNLDELRPAAGGCPVRIHEASLPGASRASPVYHHLPE